MITAIIQARLGSTRLPRKALADIGGKTLIRRVVDRAQKIRQVDRLMLAIPGSEREQWRGVDVGAVKIVFVNGIHESDLLGRYASTLRLEPDTRICVRITGDCPLLSPEIADLVIATYRARGDVDYLSNVAPGYVDGTDVEVFSAEALFRADREATDPEDREHVGRWMSRNLRKGLVYPFHASKVMKTSVDTEADLALVRELVACGA